MSDKKDWVSCPKCRRRIFRFTRDGIEVAPGSRIFQPMGRPDEVAIAQCPRGHMASPPQEPPFS